MRVIRLLVTSVVCAGFGVVLGLLATPPAVAQVCTGDCNGNHVVAINELVVGVNIALGAASVQTCTAADRDDDGAVSIAELVAAVTNALRGCPATATPTASATATATLTASTTATASITATATATGTATLTPSPTVTSTVTSTVTPSPTATPTVQPPLLVVQTNPGRVAPGESGMISITVTNRAPVPLVGVVIRANLPGSGITGVSRDFISGGGSCSNFSCNPGQQVSWSIGTMPPQSGQTVSFPLTVVSGTNAPADNTELTTFVTAVAPGATQVAANAVLIVDRTRALALTLDANSNPAQSGSELHYRLAYGNRGVATMPGATIEMTVPLGTTFESASDGGVIVTDTVTWFLGDLPAGASGVRELVVQVDAPSGQAIAAAATLASGAASVDAETITRVETLPPLSLSVSLGPDPVAPGEPMLVTLTVTNRGPIELFDVAAAIRIPPEVSAVGTADATGASCRVGATFACDNFERALWAIGNLAAGQGVTLSLPPVVLSGQSAPASGTLISFDADATATGTALVQVRRSVPVQTNRPLDLQLDVNPQPVLAGGELHYAVTFGNRGISVLPGATLSLPLPAGTSFQSAGDGVFADGVVTWALGDLAAGAGGVRELIATADADAVDGLPIAAAATLTSGAVQARAEAVTRVDSSALTMHIALGPDPVSPGEPLAVSVTVTNRGAVILFAVQAALRVPNEVAAFSPSFTNGSVTCSADTTFSCDALERALWTIGDLSPGEGATLTFPAIVLSGQTAPPAGAVITFAGDASANDGSRAQALRSAQVRPNRPAELEIDANPMPIGAGELLHYRLTFGNRGTGILAGATLSIPIPARTTFDSASDGGTPQDGAVVWSLGDLAPGAAGVRELVVQVDPDAVAGLPIPAEAVLSTAGGAARAYAVSRVANDTPLTVSVSAAPDPVTPGEPMQVFVTVTNRGPTTLFSVAAALRVPNEVAAYAPNFTNEGGTCSAGATFSCDNLERELWLLGNLAPGQAVTLSIPPTVLSGQGGPPSGAVIVYEADATANDGSQALARDSVAVQTSRPGEVEVDASPQPVANDEDLTYTIAYGNRGLTTLANATLEFPIPVGTMFQSAPDGGSIVSNVVGWSLGDLAPGAGGTRQVVVSVNSDTAAGAPVAARATLVGDGSTARAQLITHVQNDVPLALDVSVGPDPIAAGQTLQVTVSVTNQGLVPLFGVQAYVRVPAEVTPFATNVTTGGASCSRGATFSCDNLEPVLFSLGTQADGLGAGQGAMLTMPPVVPTGAKQPPSGTLIGFEVDVTANDGTQVRARPSARVQ